MDHRLHDSRTAARRLMNSSAVACDSIAGRRGSMTTSATPQGSATPMEWCPMVRASAGPFQLRRNDAHPAPCACLSSTFRQCQLVVSCGEKGRGESPPFATLLSDGSAIIPDSARHAHCKLHASQCVRRSLEIVNETGPLDPRQAFPICTRKQHVCRRHMAEARLETAGRGAAQTQAHAKDSARDGKRMIAR